MCEVIILKLGSFSNDNWEFKTTQGSSFIGESCKDTTCKHYFVRGYRIVGFIRMSSILVCCVESVVLSKVLKLHITTQYIWCAATRYVTYIWIISSDPNARIYFTIWLKRVLTMRHRDWVAVQKLRYHPENEVTAERCEMITRKPKLVLYSEILRGNLYK